MRFGRFLRLLVVAGLAPAVGCGYALVGKGSSIPDDVRNVIVSPLLNETSRNLVDQRLTEAVTDEMVVRQRFTVVNSIAEADARLSGAVTRFRVIPVEFNNDGIATRYQITIGARIDFSRTGEDEEVIWSSDHYSFRQDYEVDAASEDFFNLEDLAIDFVAGDFAKTLITDLQSGF